jgi:hypothetical protein
VEGEDTVKYFIQYKIGGFWVASLALPFTRDTKREAEKYLSDYIEQNPKEKSKYRVKGRS